MNEFDFPQIIIKYFAYANFCYSKIVYRKGKQVKRGDFMDYNT